MDIVIRATIAVSLIGLGLTAFWAFNRLQLRRVGSPQRSPGMEAWQPGRPAIVYFTTPECGPCRTMQRPAIERLRGDLADTFQVLEVDASQRPSVADHWGVLSVPTTFIIDTLGQPRHVNHGVAGAEKLRRQLEPLYSEGGS